MKKDEIKISYSTNNKSLSIKYNNENILKLNQDNGDIYICDELIGTDKDVVNFFKNNLL